MKKILLTVALLGNLAWSHNGHMNGTKIFGPNFQQEINQDQADINRAAVGGSFLSDYFEPFFQLHRGVFPFSLLQKQIKSEQEYFDREANKGWLDLIIGSEDETGIQAINLDEVLSEFRKLTDDMYLYLDRTSSDAKRLISIQNLYNKIAETTETYSVEVKTFYNGIEDGETVIEQKPAHLLEDLLGRPEYTQISEKEVMHEGKLQKETITRTSRKEKGRLEILLQNLSQKLKTVLTSVDSEGNTGIVWKKKKDTLGRDTEEDLANSTVKIGLIAEIQHLNKIADGLIKIIDRINIPELANLYTDGKFVGNFGETLISMIEKQQDISNDALTIPLANIEKSLKYLTPMITRTYNYAY